MFVPDRIKAAIVDDNAYARAATAATLRKLGLVTIDEFAAAAPAVGALIGLSYDVMFLDRYMPDMNGAALLEVIRDKRFSPHGRLPVIMMTAYPNRETFAKARELGASEVLTKPFTAAHVSAALGRVLPDSWQIPADAPPAAAPADEAKFFL